MAVRLLVLLTALMGLFVLAQPARATHVECGEVITQDTTLDSDVVCEGETYGVTGITIGADHLTLDLAGHTVRGEPAFQPGSNAVATDTQRTDVTVRGGTVRGFGVGINLTASDSVIERVTSLGNGGVGFWVRGNDNVVRRSLVRHSAEFGVSVRGDRFLLERSVIGGQITCSVVSGERPQLSRNVISDCYWAGGIDGYTTALVARNSISGSASGFSVHGQGARIERNDFSGNEGTGLYVGDPGAIVQENTANDNRDPDLTEPVASGIEVGVAGVIVRRNIANRNAEYGIEAVPGTIDGGGNRASGNGVADCVNVRCQ